MRRPDSWLKTFVARGFLALALLLGQQAATLHWLSHSIEATHAKGGASNAPSDHCDDCVSFGAFGATPASSHVPLFTGAVHPAPVAPAVEHLAPAALRLGFRSRAPPILV